jgi:hypothetical protein
MTSGQVSRASWGAADRGRDGLVRCLAQSAVHQAAGARCWIEVTQTPVPAVGGGIDWAEDHHDIVIVDEHGAIIVFDRITNDAADSAQLVQILVHHDPRGSPLTVAIETSRALLVTGLHAAGRHV